MPSTIFARYYASFTIIVLIIFFLSCKKSTDVHQPDVSGTKAIPVSMTVNYYFGQNPHIWYNFVRNTTLNEYTIYRKDSVPMDPGGFYKQLTTKTYFVSSGDPQRVTKISFRQYAYSETQSATLLCYDELFDYSDNTATPSQITVKTYGDTLGANVTSEQTIPVDPWVTGEGWGPGGLNILTNYFSEPQRTPMGGSKVDGRSYLGANLLLQYTDTTYEDEIHRPSYAATLFSFDGGGLVYRGLYIFNSDKNVKTLIWDQLSDNSGDPPSLDAKRRFDFTYDNAEPQIASLFNFTNISDFWNVLHWEQSTSYATGMIDYYGQSASYPPIDSYLPDTFVFYQDLCSSYTDSSFTIAHTWDSQHGVYLVDPVVQLVSAKTYTNNIFKDSIGRISRLTKTDEAGTVYREITLGY